MVYRLSPLDDVFSVGAALLYGLLALLDVGLFIFSFYRDRSSARHRVLAGWRMRLVFALLVALGVGMSSFMSGSGVSVVLALRRERIVF
jgi:hypothetical protein